VEPAALVPVEFSGPAVEKFGAETVQSVYEWVIAYLNGTTYRPELIVKDASRTEDAYEFAAQYMTPRMAENYRALVQRSFDEDSDADDTLFGFSYFNINFREEISMRTPMVTNHTISSPRASVSADGRLTFELTETGTFRMAWVEDPMVLHHRKTVTISLTPGGDSGGQWLIDEYQATWDADDWVPDTSPN
jgi:hypothetical protein